MVQCCPICIRSMRDAQSSQDGPDSGQLDGNCPTSSSCSGISCAIGCIWRKLCVSRHLDLLRTSASFFSRKKHPTVRFQLNWFFFFSCWMSFPWSSVFYIFTILWQAKVTISVVNTKAHSDSVLISFLQKNQIYRARSALSSQSRFH